MRLLRAWWLDRRGFSLLEVMIALSILTVSLLILVESQSTAAWATREAERYVTATDLARYMLTEAEMRVETDGFGDGEVFERGDFRDLGDEVLTLQMGDALKDFRWEYAIQEIDVQLAGDIAGMVEDFTGGGEGGGGAAAAGDVPAGGGMPGMGGLGALMSPDMISQMLGPYIREVRVRVWWGRNSDEAEELGQEVVLITHVINPSGELANIGAQAMQ